ncbi:hypothetical protein F4859DRAFT_458828 [Xylaria cf. heliscus]|nr:hypothetical protein F4859DRAFT_458828 [Xylaria cf. heliscus]
MGVSLQATKTSFFFFFFSLTLIPFLTVFPSCGIGGWELIHHHEVGTRDPASYPGSPPLCTRTRTSGTQERGVKHSAIQYKLLEVGSFSPIRTYLQLQ